MDRFSGGLDRVDDETVQGWFVHHDQTTQKSKVTLWLDDEKIEEVISSQFRQDLADANIHDGFCAFTMDLPTELFKHKSSFGKILKIYVEYKEERCLLVERELQGSLLFLSDESWPVLNNAIQRASILQKTQNKNEEAVTLADKAQVDASEVTKPLFESTAGADSSQTATGIAKQVSPYLVYARDRFFRQHETFRFEDDPDEIDNLLVWYLESYGLHRKPVKVPLGKTEIDYCNELIHFPNCSYRFSRYHLQYLSKTLGQINLTQMLSSRPEYCSHLFGWVTETLPSLNLDDVLMPEEYETMLKGIVQQNTPVKTPLNQFYEFAYDANSDWNVFDKSKALHRKCIYFLGLLKSIDNPCYYHFIPKQTRNELLEDIANKDSKFLAKLSEGLKPSVFEWLQGVDLFALLEQKFSKVRYSAKHARYCTLDSDGNRTDSASIVVDHLQDDCDIQLIGPINKSSGLGQATRMSAEVLAHSGLDVSLYDFDLDNPAPVGFNKEVRGTDLKKAKVNLIHLNAESIPLVFSYLPNVLEDSYNIGYFFWELDSPAKCHELALELLDEVWVSTEYGVTQYKDSTDIPVVNVGMTFEALHTDSKDECRERFCSQYGIDSNSKIFLTTFDAMSFVQRKNPQCVINAFNQAFDDDDNVTLVLKTQNRDYVADAQQLRVWRSLESIIADNPRITLINETMHYQDVLTMKKAADCYVSLHRSEGWGFGMIEAMNLETPVICTGYSGNMDFCRDDNCWLVDYQDKYLADWDYIFVIPGQKWAEPSAEHAAKCMRELYENPEMAEQKSVAAKAFIEQYFGKEAISQCYRKRFDEIVSGTEAGSTRLDTAA